MSVYIKGMEMPRFGYREIRIYPDGKVVERPHPEYPGYEECLGKAVPVPKHGRLIDADALDAGLKEMSEIEWNQKAFPVSWAHAFDAFRCIIKRDEPTIIEAEEGE